MRDSRYKIIEEQYVAKASLRKSPFLYRLLKSFELHRVDKVSSLVEGRKLKVMDVGCGDGKFIFQNQNKWKHAVCVDVVKELLTSAKKRYYSHKVEFLSSDFGLEKMQFNKNSFDLIVSISTIQYILDLDLFFTEARRVLKPGGKLIIEVPNCAVFWRRISFLRGKFPRVTEYENGWDGGVLHYFTQENLRRFLERKDFEIESFSCSGIFSRVRSIAPGFLGADLVVVCRKRKK